MPTPTSTSQANFVVHDDNSTPVTTDNGASTSTGEPITPPPSPQGAITCAQIRQVFPKTYTNVIVRYDPKKRACFC